MAFAALILSVSILFFTANAKPSIDSRIVGGHLAEEKQFPYAAALFINKGSDNENFCGGTLISPEYVLTAAHCAVDVITQMTVVLGAIGIDFVTPQRVVMNSSDIIIPDNYTTKVYDWDLALVKLPEPVGLTDYIQPIKLAEGDDDFTGDNATVLGWGIQWGGQTTYEPYLRYTDNPILSKEDCVKDNPTYKQIVLDTHICQSGEDYKAACHGDSGGPLVVDGVQVGIVSVGPDSCFRKTPVIFTRISSFRSWIKENAGV